MPATMSTQSSTSGELLETREFPTNAVGINRAVDWVARRTGADADTFWVIEGAATYGASSVDLLADGLRGT
jgi:hypothetical protein